MATFYETLKIKNKWSPTLLKRAEVVGVGVGYANPKKPAAGAGLVVYTKNNLSSTALTKLHQQISAAVLNVPVRLISSGGFHAHMATPAKVKARPTQFRNRIRPIPGGVSVGHVDPFSTGTGGLIVIRNGQLFILSNNHVLIKNNSAVYSETIQPGPADGGQTGTDRVGRAFQYEPLNRSGANYIDAAIALPLSNSTLNPRYLTGNNSYINVPGHLLSFRVGEAFFKSGRTTGLVGGVVETIGTDMQINYGGSLGTFTFRNQAIIRGNRPVSLPGDSGSVWLRQSDRYAAALNFAGTSDGLRSISNPLATVMNALGLRVAIPAAGGAKAGAVKGAAPAGKFMYVRPLSRTQFSQIRVMKVKSSKSR